MLSTLLHVAKSEKFVSSFIRNIVSLLLLCARNRPKEQQFVFSDVQT